MNLKTPGVGKPCAALYYKRKMLREEGSEDDALRFNASFESGNLAEVRLVCVSPLEYDLHIRPDTLNARHRVWFFFSVSNVRRTQKVIFNIIGYSKVKSLFRDGMAPCVSSTRRPFWERMPQASVYYYRSPRHDRQYVLSFPFCFEKPDETYFFAYSYPYTYSYLQVAIDACGQLFSHISRRPPPPPPPPLPLPPPPLLDHLS